MKLPEDEIRKYAGTVRLEEWQMFRTRFQWNYECDTAAERADWNEHYPSRFMEQERSALEEQLRDE
jgi:hypothetical protein